MAKELKQMTIYIKTNIINKMKYTKNIRDD